MKINWAERWVVNNPLRVMEQEIEIRWMRSKMPLRPGGTILEIGSGRGAGAGLILREFHPATLHASDLDFDMIRRAKSYLSADARNRISLLTADATHLPYRDESFDALFGFGFLHHVLDWRAAVAEIARVLKAGGTYYMEEIYPVLYQNFITRHLLLHPTKDRFGSKELRTVLIKEGFSFLDALDLKFAGILAVLKRK